MVYGYARVPTASSNLDDLARLFRTIDIASDNMFIEGTSDRNIEREQYMLLKRCLRKGDIVYLDSFESLGSSYTTMLREWIEITQAIGADIVALNQVSLFDSRKFHNSEECGTALGAQFLSMLSYVAANEYRNQAANAALRMQTGHVLGRNRKGEPEGIESIVERWLEGEISGTEAIKLSGLSRTTFYNRYGIRKLRRDDTIDDWE